MIKKIIKKIICFFKNILIENGKLKNQVTLAYPLLQHFLPKGCISAQGFVDISVVNKLDVQLCERLIEAFKQSNKQNFIKSNQLSIWDDIGNNYHGDLYWNATLKL